MHARSALEERLADVERQAEEERQKLSQQLAGDLGRDLARRTVRARSVRELELHQLACARGRMLDAQWA